MGTVPQRDQVGRSLADLKVTATGGFEVACSTGLKCASSRKRFNYIMLHATDHHYKNPVGKVKHFRRKTQLGAWQGSSLAAAYSQGNQSPARHGYFAGDRGGKG